MTGDAQGLRPFLLVTGLAFAHGRKVDAVSPPAGRAVAHGTGDSRVRVGTVGELHVRIAGDALRRPGPRFAVPGRHLRGKRLGALVAGVAFRRSNRTGRPGIGAVAGVAGPLGHRQVLGVAELAGLAAG